MAIVRELQIEGLPSTDRVFESDLGFYFRSTFTVSRKPTCTHCQNIKMEKGTPRFVFTQAELSECDDQGVVLLDENNEPRVRIVHNNSMVTASIVKMGYEVDPNAAPLEAARLGWKEHKKDLKNRLIEEIEGAYVEASIFNG